jgi:hypothetical protein
MDRATLPAKAIDLLSGIGPALDISQALHVAYWMHGRDDGCALHHWDWAHEQLAALADALGYTIAPKGKPQPCAACLQAEWNRICDDMNRGSWRGTEAEALARIEAIKAEIAAMQGAA